jgi:hypothetical protein
MADGSAGEIILHHPHVEIVEEDVRLFPVDQRELLTQILIYVTVPEVISRLSMQPEATHPAGAALILI